MPQMDEAVVQTAPVSEASVKRTGWLIPIVVFGLLWFELINQLKPEWWLNPQYNYGLIVPLLALYLFWKRWRVRPTPAPPAATTFPIPLMLLCAALALPIRFLGELYYFTASRRLILIVIGALLAFVCNVVRTAILVWAGTTSGPKSIEAWHDPAGLTILMACLLGLWVASLIMQRRGNASPIARSIDNQRARIQLNWSLLGALAIWLLLVELGVQIWYRSHHTLIRSRWVVRWPESESHYKQVPVAPAAETLLRYNEGGGAAWEGPDGRQWMMYFFRWLPGRTAARFVKIP